ncbi:MULTISPECIES: tripartite tricarboxylate transporter TctB family protein [Rhizobium]|uniref:Tripartite tricarboxylate transporter TctB family protein n=1 Tax=Rhizobium bangladeshense TaxID=1138189 RepID=A0ABS7LJV9_9HYPH|nr:MULTISPECIES: tripartite tricarboxylate transporter TctB family protein [Rhizobium]MBX4868888.1 tripartite tricarboxylate transporter TctB family protein [Rhizobium bangladeshense]MBX4873658.1 tripartite tricarboxylate transporter TctB family protein [Rhizobium bangladeshense]MBX4884657.1 tripartite tricarboxylate transporter TctB family protein [Rhizobium bangladeshense]MBX4891759.1 tripartite tricarboxylate transporter TctB family protein [Rhizobium bangladeshense]MBX4895618.1 tripartite 
MKSISFDTTNAICGALFIATGAFFALQSLGLDLGTALRMGPGYFPFILACALILLGAIIFIQALRVEGEPVDPFAWRGMLFILPAPVFFGLTVRGLGFAPALFFTAFIACFASRRMNVVYAVILSLLLTIFSVAVFSYGLGLPFERFGPWVRF